MSHDDVEVDDAVTSFLNSIGEGDNESESSVPQPRQVKHEDYLLPPRYLFVLSAAMFGIGVAGGMKYAWKGKARRGVVTKVAKVFMAGTALCFGTFGLLVFGVAKFMGVNSIKEFGDRMSSIVPEKTKAIQKVSTTEKSTNSTTELT